MPITPQRLEEVRLLEEVVAVAEQASGPIDLVELDRTLLVDRPRQLLASPGQVGPPTVDVTPQNPCPDASPGWSWRCLVHRAHGVVSSRREAEHNADCHTEFMTREGEQACRVEVRRG